MKQRFRNELPDSSVEEPEDVTTNFTKYTSAKEDKENFNYINYQSKRSNETELQGEKRAPFSEIFENKRNS